MSHEEDILETALNSGIRFAAGKYSMTEQDVRNIVQKFKNEIDDNPLCHCDSERLKGNARMCFFCIPPTPRIKL